MTAETPPEARQPETAPTVAAPPNGKPPARVEAESDKTATERLVFFSDAVMAIAITLLALELPIPEGGSTTAAWRDMGHHFEAYLAFLISFWVIAQLWFAHHWLYRYVTRVHRRVARVNMLWLLTVVVTPFATRVLVGETPFPMAFTLYAGVQAIGQALLLTTIFMIRRDHLTAAEVPAGVFDRAITRNVVIGATFALSIPIAYFTHWAYVLWAAAPMLGRLLTYLTNRLRRTPPDPAAD